MNLNLISNNIRKLTVESIYQAQSGHPGGSLSIAEILAVLYFKVMNVDANNPEDINRDRFVLSKGHCAPAYYATLALKGYFDVEDLSRLRSGHEELQGHPSMLKTKGVDFSTGSLGQGLSIANGMALYAKKNNKDYKVFCLCGDGEIQEGQIWEAAMFAPHYKLDNLIVIVDYNGLQIDGKVEDVMNHHSISKKFESFNWDVIEVDGHDIKQLELALKTSYQKADKPTCIVAKTTKGKGVSFMENQAGWHGGAPNKEQFEMAMKDLCKGECHD
ncbi:MAG: transketolase [Erysipelotrichaceae bacterium]